MCDTIREIEERLEKDRKFAAFTFQKSNIKLYHNIVNLELCGDEFLLDYQVNLDIDANECDEGKVHTYLHMCSIIVN